MLAGIDVLQMDWRCILFIVKCLEVSLPFSLRVSLTRRLATDSSREFSTPRMNEGLLSRVSSAFPIQQRWFTH